jgi:hypothetical protein
MLLFLCASHAIKGIGVGDGNKLELVQKAMAGRSKGWWQRAKGPISSSPVPLACLVLPVTFFHHPSPLLPPLCTPWLPIPSLSLLILLRMVSSVD